VERPPLLQRIGTKILLTLLSVSLLALAVTAAALTGLASRTLRQNISQRNLQIARRAASEIDLYLERGVSELRALAEILAPLRDPWLQDTLLENLSVTFRRFRSLHLVAESGQVICSSLLDRRDPVSWDPQALPVALSGRLYLSPVRLSADRLPYLTMAVQAGMAGGVTRVLVAELALRDIWDLVDAISFGEQGEAVLLSDTGLLIAHPDKRRVITETHAPPFPPGTELPAGGRVTVYRPAQGESLLVAVAPVRTTSWVLVLQQPLAQAYLPLRNVFLRSLLALAAVLGAAVLSSFLLAQRISGPLNLLVAGTLRIGRGELEHRLPVVTRDEIGQLSEAFNRMAGDLGTWSRRLRESEERYRLITESVEDLIFSLDGRGILLFANRQTERISGYPMQELVGRQCVDFLTPESRGRAASLWQKRPMGTMREGLELEVELMTRQGETRILEVKLTRVFTSSGQLQFYGAGRDVTQRKEAEGRVLHYQQQLRSLASELSVAEARERKRIAGELHDRIGQALSLTRIRLASLRAGEESESRLKQVADTMELVDQTIRDVHALTFELSSPLLYEVGLKAALEQLTEQFGKQHGLPVCFVDDARAKPLDNDRSVLLFQAVKELLLNAVKHGQARHITVSLRRQEEQVRITVEDDGVGFEVTERAFRPGPAGGFGLFNIRERLEYLGGNLQLVSRPGEGTRVHLALALNGATIGTGQGSP
jgi:PAS domain S-box-containing protein